MGMKEGRKKLREGDRDREDRDTERIDKRRAQRTGSREIQKGASYSLRTLALAVSSHRPLWQERNAFKKQMNLLRHAVISSGFPLAKKNRRCTIGAWKVGQSRKKERGRGLR